MTKPVMHADTVEYLRLLPSDSTNPTDSEQGVLLFVGRGAHGDYALTLSAADTARLAHDLQAHLDGWLDIANPAPNYGNDC